MSSPKWYGLWGCRHGGNSVSVGIMGAMAILLDVGAESLETTVGTIGIGMMAATPQVTAWETSLLLVLYKAITPYKPDGWRWALSSAGLTHKFPNLVHDITYGAPIGNPPPLTHTSFPTIWSWLTSTPHTWMPSYKKNWTRATWMVQAQYKKHISFLAAISTLLPSVL